MSAAIYAMKSSALALALLLAGCASDVTPSPSLISEAKPEVIGSAGYAVVPAEQNSFPSIAPSWTPTEAEIGLCEGALAKALAKQNKSLAHYYLRLSGVTGESDRSIDGYGAHKQAPGAVQYLTPANEETVLLPAFGGGDLYFRFSFDCEDRKLVLLRFNAAL